MGRPMPHLRQSLVCRLILFTLVAFGECSQLGIPKRTIEQPQPASATSTKSPSPHLPDAWVRPCDRVRMRSCGGFFVSSSPRRLGPLSATCESFGPFWWRMTCTPGIPRTSKGARSKGHTLCSSQSSALPCEVHLRVPYNIDVTGAPVSSMASTLTWT